MLELDLLTGYGRSFRWGFGFPGFGVLGFDISVGWVWIVGGCWDLVWVAMVQVCTSLFCFWSMG